MSSRWERMIARVIGGGRVRRRRANPVLGIYRWRYETVLVAGAVAWLWTGVEHGAPVWVASTGVALGVAAVLTVWPPARRFIAGRFWVIVVQHRLRTGFHESGLANLSGRTPAILWAAPRSEVVRVCVLMPAGIDVTALVDERGVLASATGASYVLVERDNRFANVAVIVVVLRSAAHRGAF